MQILYQSRLPQLLLVLFVAAWLAACGAGPTSQPSGPTLAPEDRPGAPARTAAPAPTPNPTRAMPVPPLATAPATATTDAIRAGFEVLDPTGRFSGQARYVRRILPNVVAYIGERAGEPLEPPVTVVVAARREGDRCAVRGLALGDERQVYLYVAEDTPRAEIATGLAHELSHVLHTQMAGGDVASATLAEGFATYAEGRYWPRWDPRTGFEGAVRRLRAQGRYVPLTTDVLACDIEVRDRVYTERAAFVDWLIEEYGRDRFWRLNRLSANPSRPDLDPGELPYVEPPVLRNNPTYEHAEWKRVYGKDLPTLEREWLASLDRDGSPR